jgi:hypothetical protein
MDLCTPSGVLGGLLERIVDKMIRSQLETNAACPSVGIDLNYIILVLVLNLDIESKKYTQYVWLAEILRCLVFVKEEVKKFGECVACGDLNLLVFWKS